MFKTLILAFLVAAVSCANWAVLVAGSDGFYNYRHQSDVFHAYQSLIKKGMNPANIIVMAYDDIAKDPMNPFPGKVFNKPSYKDPGQDVYQGVVIDYKGASVTPQVFMDVLLGNKAAVAAKGSGRVLETTEQDNVFIFFSDHGAVGLIAFPNQYLYAKDLIATLNQMKGKYAKLVFYLETCESGSMFVNLPKNTNIYALSAAGTSESSWATYCSPDDVVQGKHVGSCLGDLFSVSFIEDFDNNDISTESLETQFQLVKKRTTLSVVNQWGDLTFQKQFVSDFIGSGANSYRGIRKQIGQLTHHSHTYKSLRPYHIKINFLTNKYKNDKSEHTLKKLLEQMNSIQTNDNIFYSIKTELNLTGEYKPEEINFHCLKESIDYFESRCGKMSEYAYQYVKFFAENCENGHAHNLEPILDMHCKA